MEKITPRSPLIMRETARGMERFRVEDAFFERRELFLTTEINADSAGELVKQFMYLSQEDPDEEITLYINSPGGEVNSGLALYDCMQLVETPIRTVCTGLAASMGSVIFLAGDRREMFPHAQIMIHDPHYGGGIEGLKPLELQERIESLMHNRSVIGELIAKKTGRSIEEIYEKTQKDSYFNAEEAIRFGLADAVVSKFCRWKERSI